MTKMWIAVTVQVPIKSELLGPRGAEIEAMAMVNRAVQPLGGHASAAQHLRTEP